MAKCIVVLGMHRSATSLVSKGLAKADVRIGKNIGPKTKSNPHGHWEDKRFLILNQKILNAAGGNWHNPPPRKNILKIKNNNKLMDILITLVKKRQAANKIWGWKDPRTTLTIELYEPYLKDVIYVTCFRNPSDVAKSLNARNGMPIQEGIDLAHEYNSRLINFLSKKVSYHG